MESKIKFIIECCLNKTFNKQNEEIKELSLLVHWLKGYDVMHNHYKKEVLSMLLDRMQDDFWDASDRADITDIMDKLE
jgi:isoleucyl-tRNA synthetase